jgi:cytochrome c oxidase assembly protein subunit 15
LVAGLDAGLTFNTWPLMDGRVVPAGLLIQSPFWRNFFESVATVQFDHRLGAYLLFAAAIFHAVWSRGPAHVSQAWRLAALVAALAALGLAALVSVVPLSLALLHQLGAVVVLSVAVIHLRAMSPPQPIEPIAAAMR